jgi:6-phosphogluconolactonase
MHVARATKAVRTFFAGRFTMQHSSSPGRAAAAHIDIPKNFACTVTATPGDLTAETAHLLERLIFDQAKNGNGGDRKKEPTTLHIALSGGTTPQKVYESFSRTHFFKRALDQGADVHLWYGDVRLVPDDDDSSNARMVRKALDGTFPECNLHPVKIELGGAEAAKDYAQQLLKAIPNKVRGGVNVPGFDIVMLGVGADGHTASLFPGTPSVACVDQVCVAVMPGKDVKPYVERVTITTPVIQAARHVVLIAAGKDKSPVLRGILASDAALEEHRGEWLVPVSRLVRSCEGTVHILVDAAIAEGSLTGR